MSQRFVSNDPSETVRVEKGPVTFHVGFIPLPKLQVLQGVVIRAQAEYGHQARSMQEYAKKDDKGDMIVSFEDIPPAKAEEHFAADAAKSRAHLELCRWGVRGWDAEGVPPAELETVTFEGVERQVLTSASVDVIDAQGWVDDAQVAVLESYTLTTAEKKTD